MPGESAAQEIEPSTRTLAVSDAHMQQYLARARRAPAAATDSVRAASMPSRRLTAARSRIMFDRFIGQRLDPEAVEQQMQLLYGRGYLEMLDYQLVQDEAGTTDSISRRCATPGVRTICASGCCCRTTSRATPSSMPRAGWILPSSTPSVPSRSGMLQVGSAPLLSTEFYQPLSNVDAIFRRAATLSRSARHPAGRGRSAGRRVPGAQLRLWPRSSGASSAIGASCGSARQQRQAAP